MNVYHNTMTTPTASLPIHDKGSWRGALSLTAIALAGFGFLYSLAGVGIGQALFPVQASGSPIVQNNQVIGSTLVAQPFTSDAYFQPRPSAASYNPMAMSGSNQARTNPDLRARLLEARQTIAERENIPVAAVPKDLYSQSGSGIDPHISPEAAAIQIRRIAHARGIDWHIIEDLVMLHTEAKQWGVFGQARVNVLRLNIALDQLPIASH